jgi:hypothetical protein
MSKILILIIATIAMVLLNGFIVMMGWNLSMHHLFASVPEMDLRHGIGLYLMVSTAKSSVKVE